MWEHLSQHVLRGLHMLSSFCCHGWVALSQPQLKAHFPPGGTCCDSLALAHRDILQPRFLAGCSRDPGGHQDAWSPPGKRCLCGSTAGNPDRTLGQSSQEPRAGFPDQTSSLSSGQSPGKAAFYWQTLNLHVCRLSLLLCRLFPLSCCSLLPPCPFILLPLSAFLLL